jgi:putative nucleotidyltransferase with HDIG domain
VATAGEAAALRAAGFDAPRVLVMGALSPPEREIALAARADVVAWEHAFLDGLPTGARVHVKLDTGMGRLGTRSPDEAAAVAEALHARGQLAGLMTHFATADAAGDAFFGEQLARFTAWALPLRERFPGVLVHAANSAATLREPAAHFDMVRAGVALYGLDPANEDPAPRGLTPALRLTSYVAAVKACSRGESAGYGRRFVAARDTVLATVPIGYGDGWRRGLTDNADVIIAGRPLPARRHGLDGQHHRRPRPRGDLRAQRRRGDADRRRDHRRGGRAPPRHAELRGDLRADRAGDAHGGLSVSAALDAARELLGGARAWVVGGAVRDRLMHRPVDDVDLVLDGDVRAAARHLAVGVGGPAFPLSDAFGGWRVVSPDRSWHVDLLPLRGGSIEADVALRDFTVNAIAEPLGGGPLVDPHDGAGDVARGRLRMVAPRAFADDPLRVLRLARFACELGLTPDPQTIAAAREQAPGAAGVAQERVFAELKRVVAAPGVLDGFALMDRLGLYEAILPELAACRGMAQNRFHHLDVHDHTLAVLRAAVDLEAHPAPLVGEENAAGVAALLAEPLADGVTRGVALRLGALLHDIAKPPTRELLGDGRVTFVGHDRVGAELAREILARWKAAERLRAHVAALTRHHLRLGFLVHERPLERRTVYRYLQACDGLPADVTLLTICDRVATRGDNAQPAITAHLALAREVLPDALAWQAAPPPEPLVRGDDLARALGITPGPRLGTLLAAIAEARWAGEVATRAEAVALARALG